MADYVFYGFFVASKAGKTGLTPTCTVYRAATGAVVANAQAATEIGLGLYRYTHTDATEGDYVAVFVTADATVDAQNVPALASVAVPRIDAAVSTRLASAGYTAPDNASITAILEDTGTTIPAAIAAIPAAPSAGDVADAVWDEAVADHGAAGSTGEALTDSAAGDDPWDGTLHPVRTLTMTAAQVAAVLDGTTIVIHRGDTLSIEIPVTVAGTYAALDFTVKQYARDPDSAAVVRVRKTPAGTGDGLITLNGEDGTPAQGSITIGAQSIVITLAAVATAQIEPADHYVYDVQEIDASGDTHTKTYGALRVVADVTRAVS